MFSLITILAADIRTNDDVAIFEGLEDVFDNIVSVVLALAGIVVFIMLILGGFNFLTSGGDPKKVESAKKTLTYAIMGIVILAASFLILRFIEYFTGADVTNFRVTIP